VTGRRGARRLILLAALAAGGCTRDQQRLALLDAPLLLTPEPAPLVPGTPLPVGRGVNRLCVGIPAGWSPAPAQRAIADGAGHAAVLGASITLGSGRILAMRFAGFRDGPAGGYCLAPAAPALEAPVIALRVWSSTPVRVMRIDWVDARAPAGTALSAPPRAPPPARRR